MYKTQENMSIEIKRALARFVNETQKRLFFSYQRERPDFHIPPQVEVHMMDTGTACITHHTVATNHHYTMCFIDMSTGSIHKPNGLKTFDESSLGNILEEGEQFIGRDGNFWIPRKGNWPSSVDAVKRTISSSKPKMAIRRPFSVLSSKVLVSDEHRGHQQDMHLQQHDSVGNQ